MLKGRPVQKAWHEYRTHKFHFGIAEGLGRQCGPYVLHTLTKHNIKKLNKLTTDGHMSNKVLFDYLKKYDYEIHPVTLGNTVEGYKNLHDKSLLHMRNVILLDQKCINGENTWAVLYNNILAHSGDVEPYNPMDLLNYPVQAAYVIWHRKWK